MIQSKSILLAAVALGALLLLAASLRPVRAAGQEGMVTVRDPQTGQLRAPTPDELRALRASKPPGAALQATQPAAPKVLGTRPNGARGVRLGEKGLVYDVVTRGPDGRLTSQCVQGEAAAHDALRNPDKAAHPADGDHKEHDHEAR
jgi:hypothetical protein